MKKIFSVILSITIVALSVSQGFNSFAQNNENRKLYSFAEQLSKMIRNNAECEETENNELEDFVEETNKFYSAAIDIATANGYNDDAFQTRRLIVKSKNLTDYQGAIDWVSGYNDLYILQYSSEVDAKLAYNYYIASDVVEYVEPDIIMSTQDTLDNNPTEIPDKEISEMDDITAEAIEWLSEKIGFTDIEKELAKRIQDDYIEVAVLDSGIDLDHEYFENRIVETNFNVSSTGIADSEEDDYGHGSHVAGIIVGNTLDNVKIKAYKVLNEFGNGSLSTIAIAVDVAVAEGANIINMSISGQGESKRMTEAVDNAVANNVNVVVAAGNKHLDLDKYYVSPACVESAITVSSTDKNDNLSIFSNYDGTIDIAAPGEDIKSCYLNNTYTSMSGTSMAAPQVTAGLSILLSLYEDLEASRCEEIIEEFAIDIYENEGENHFGAGLLYLKYLLDEKPTTADPIFSVDSCDFSESFEVSISCPEEADIYYIIYDTGDWDSINWFKEIKYSSPIKITVNTKIAAVAIGAGKKPSSIVTVEYNRTSDSEEDYYDINALGYITGYYGTCEDVVVPEIIKGKVVKGIATYAFENNDTVRTITLPDTLERINLNAFSGAQKLESITGDGVTNISVYAFYNCKELTDFDFPNLEFIADYAFAGSGLKQVSLPGITEIGTNAFNGCTKLETVSMPDLENVSIGLFRDCTALKSVDLGAVTNVGANAFRNTGLEHIKLAKADVLGNYAFADCNQLKVVYMPEITSTGAYLFQNCSVLRTISFPKLTELNSNIFKSCPKLETLALPSVTNVVKNAFAGSSIKYLRFDCVETIKSLPDALSLLMVTSTLNSISATVPNTDFVVCGYSGTYAQTFANSKNKIFYSVPIIVSDLDEQVDAEKGIILTYAQGFNCTYQWYKNDTISIVGGTPIDGATSFYYKPSREDRAEAYYCVITSTDGINTETTTTKVIANAPEFKDADYTEYEALYKEYQTINRDLYSDNAFDAVDELFAIDVKHFSLAEQDLLNNHIEEIKKAINKALNEVKYTICDINNDGKISVADARLVLKAVVGSETLTEIQKLAADINEDGKITISDSRAILKTVLEQ